MIEIEMLLWKIAVWAYHPPWITGNRLQCWWYRKNSLLQEWLTWRWKVELGRLERLEDLSDDI